MVNAFHDLQADYDKREYYVVDRASGRIVATYPYKAKSENSRGAAAGRAQLHRMELNKHSEPAPPTSAEMRERIKKHGVQGAYHNAAPWWRAQW